MTVRHHGVIDRRDYVRTPNCRLTATFDQTFSILRRHESESDAAIWEELGERSWLRFVRAVVDEPKVFTLEDQDFLKACGVSTAFPWWISSPTDLIDRGTPLKPKEEEKCK